jgi:MerC mercury resistance protein
MPPERSKLVWLSGFATVLSLTACYGTVAVVAVLGALGVAIALDEALWAGAIVAFAALAVGGLVVGFSHHRQVWPLVIGGLGALAVGYAMYVHFVRLIELSGFVLLCAGSVWDWRLRRGRQPGERKAE